MLARRICTGTRSQDLSRECLHRQPPAHRSSPRSPRIQLPSWLDLTIAKRLQGCSQHVTAASVPIRLPSARDHSLNTDSAGPQRPRASHDVNGERQVDSRPIGHRSREPSNTFYHVGKGSSQRYSDHPYTTGAKSLSRCYRHAVLEDELPAQFVAVHVRG